MKTKKIIGAAVAIVLLSSCYHKSELKHENGVVVEKQFKPEFNAEGTSYNTNGELGIHTLHDDEKFITVIKCQHGVVFSINRNDVYANLEKGDTINILFYELLNGNNEVKGFDFVNAVKNN